MMKENVRQYERENHRWISNRVGDLTGTYFTYLRKKARERKLEFLVTKEELWDLFERQKHKCALSGVLITLSTKINSQHNVDRTEHTASLDRIDNTKGYTIDNVQWVHKTVNRMRGQYSIDEYVEWCKKITNHSNFNGRHNKECIPFNKELWRDFL